MAIIFDDELRDDTCDCVIEMELFMAGGGGGDVAAVEVNIVVAAV